LSRREDKGLTKNTATSLDAGQYAQHEIEKYEAIYGRNFISPGGQDTAREFLALLALQPGMHVLDIGCGLGGSAFLMAGEHGVRVHGIDLSTNMLHIAQERCREAGLADRVTFAHGDILDFDRSATFDRVYSRDVFLHIQDKARLMQVIRWCLAPDGLLLFTDYCHGEGNLSEEFAAYIKQRNYFLHTVNEYHTLLERAGFADIAAQDRTAQFIQILGHELARLPIERFSPAENAALRQSWQEKIARARCGEQRWGFFMARRGRSD
jgi:phosphoethanolamine N-methyltransferase